MGVTNFFSLVVKDLMGWCLSSIRNTVAVKNVTCHLLVPYLHVFKIDIKIGRTGTTFIDVCTILTYSLQSYCAALY